jgi:hypothetical protein
MHLPTRLLLPLQNPPDPSILDDTPTGSIRSAIRPPLQNYLSTTAWYEDADSALANISMPLPGRNSLPVGAQSSAKSAQARACHNCRRRRLRCDRSIPSCHKCSTSGEECLGYGTVLRWANAPALRGRLAPGAAGELTVQSPGQGRGRTRPLKSSSAGEDESEPRLSIHKALNPLLNHLNSRARHYVHHCKLKHPRAMEPLWDQHRSYQGCSFHSRVPGPGFL